MKKSAKPLQTVATMDYDHVFERLISLPQFFLLMLAVAFAVFMQWMIALVILVLAIIFGYRISIRDPRTGRSWNVSRKNWYQYCDYNHIDRRHLREQMNVEIIAQRIRQRQLRNS